MLATKRPAHAIESSDGNWTNEDDLLNSRANLRTSTNDVTEIEEDDQEIDRLQRWCESAFIGLVHYDET